MDVIVVFIEDYEDMPRPTGRQNKANYFVLRDA